MKIIILLAMSTTALLAAGAGVEVYTTLDDHYDVDSLINNVPLLQSFVDCYKNVGPCSELAASYKKYSPEAIREACRKCNPAQKKLFGRFLQVLKQVLPHEYVIYRRLYDPENKYFNALEKELFKYTPQS